VLRGLFLGRGVAGGGAEVVGPVFLMDEETAEVVAEVAFGGVRG